MKIKLRLNVRILLFTVSIMALVFYITLSIVDKKLRTDTYAETMKLNESEAMKYASFFKTSIGQDFNKLKVLKNIYEGSSNLPSNERLNLYENELKKVLSNNDHLQSIWDSWELNSLDSSWNQPYGRISRVFFKDNFNNINIKKDSLDLEGDDFDNFYCFFKLVPEIGITNPYKSSLTGLVKDETLRSSIVVPIENNNKFAGLIGIDYDLQYFQSIIDSINKDQVYEVMLLSFNGDIITHSNKLLIGQNIVVADTFLTKRFHILDKIQSDSTSNFILKDKFGNDSSYFTISSFSISDTHTPWAVLISAPLTEIKQHFKTTSKILTNTAIVGLIILSIIVLLLAYSIVRPITKTNKVLEKLAIGDVHNIKPLKIKTQDELGDMAKSANTVAKGLNEVTVFAENIGAGNYNYKFNKLSDNDTLGIAVIEMRNSLKKAREDEALRKKEANQLEWASAGMNIFNKVLRIDNKTLETLTYDIIKTLTTYLDAHMGGIYVKTDLNEKEFELISFIGFSKKKYTKKFIKPEDGDVGRCILEKQTIFINDVPSDFSKVISGLGSSVPKAILIVPLISNRNLIGILEIESLNVIEQYKINFVERIAETIASTVETVKVNANTTILLNKAQQQAEELEEQEEEMRQNMEEMQATQEEASKQEMILSSFIDGFKKMLPVIEYSIDGKIIDVNDLYLNIYKVNRSQMLGKMHKSDSFMTESEKSNHKIFWQKLVDGEEQELLEHINVKKNSYWINEKYIPIKDQYGIVQKILCIGFDVTKLKQKEKKILNNKNTDIPKIDLNKKYKTIDLAYFKMIYKKDAVKIYNVLKIYYETLPVQIKNIETLINTRDYDNLKIDINNLKNKISDLGKKPINDKIHNIENILDSKRNLANIPDLVKEFIDLWMEMREEMKIILKI